MLVSRELALAQHHHRLREAELEAPARRVLAARRAQRRAERAACRAREAAEQAVAAASMV